MKHEPTIEFATAMAQGADRWVPACGGHEKEFRYGDYRYLYCYNPNRHEHAYLNLDTDLIEPFPPFLE